MEQEGGSREGQWDRTGEEGGARQQGREVGQQGREGGSRTGKRGKSAACSRMQRVQLCREEEAAGCCLVYEGDGSSSIADRRKMQQSVT